MELDIQEKPDEILIICRENISDYDSTDLKKVMVDLLEKKPKKVVFNMNDVLSISSSAIGKLLMFYKNLASFNGVLEINGVNDDLYALFTSIKLDRLFTIKK